MFRVKEVTNRELVNSQTGECFIKQSVNIVEQSGCLGLGSGKSLWLNAPQNKFTEGQELKVTYAQIAEDYNIKEVTTKSGRNNLESGTQIQIGFPA